MENESISETNSESVKQTDVSKCDEETRDEKGRFLPGHEKVGGRRKKTIWDYLRKGEDEDKLRKFINDPTKLEKLVEYILGKPAQDNNHTGEIKIILEQEIAEKNVDPSTINDSEGQAQV